MWTATDGCEKQTVSLLFLAGVRGPVLRPLHQQQVNECTPWNEQWLLGDQHLLLPLISGLYIYGYPFHPSTHIVPLKVAPL